MTYIINKTNPFDGEDILIEEFSIDGTVHPLSSKLNTGAIKASTSISLIGRGTANYGERISENMINILENFSGSTPPTNPINGQVWASRIDYVRNDTTWYMWDKSLSSWTTFTPTDGMPSTFVDGEFWFDGTTLRRAISKPNSPLNQTTISLNFATVEGNIDPNAVGYKPIVELLVYNNGTWIGSNDVLASPIQPTRVTTGKVWYDTIEDKLKIYINGQFVSIFDGYLSTSGGSMQGDIDMGNNKISNLSDPIDDGDAINLKYFTDNAPNSDDIVTFLSELDDVEIISDGTLPPNLAVLQWNLSDEYWEPKSLDINDLSDLRGNVTATEIGYLSNTTENIKNSFDDRLKRDGSDNMQGELHMSNNKITNLAEPTNDSDATTKLYVDDQIADSGASFLDDLTDVTYPSTPTDLQVLKFNDVTSEWNPSALNLADIVDISATGVSASEFEYLIGLDQNVDIRFDNIETTVNGFSSDIQSRVLKSGDTMTGALVMSDNKITNLKLPTNDNDAATKKYVDDKSGGPPLAHVHKTSSFDVPTDTVTLVTNYNTILDEHGVFNATGSHFDLENFPDAGSVGLYRITAHVKWRNFATPDTEVYVKMDTGVGYEIHYKMPPDSGSDGLNQSFTNIVRMPNTANSIKLTLFQDSGVDQSCSSAMITVEAIDSDV